eukprot:TRINITY_DN24411_c0_g3_i2.p1 TRINITY_DN24411_c0_g3~~TRINITY_DN24411_c0_g3_i2.p1  ORF type:complete len:793 (+),score=211.77 TRINITY_DN24411_c0_g3_i2:256-2379(+)
MDHTPSPPPHKGDTIEVILTNGTPVTVTLERYENIRCAFEVSDLDQSGFLERAEVVQVLERVCGGGNEKPLTMEEIESVIAAVDYNDDGKISFEEFLDFVLRIQSDPTLTDGEREMFESIGKSFIVTANASESSSGLSTVGGVAGKSDVMDVELTEEEEALERVDLRKLPLMERIGARFLHRYARARRAFIFRQVKKRRNSSTHPLIRAAMWSDSMVPELVLDGLDDEDRERVENQIAKKEIDISGDNPDDYIHVALQYDPKGDGKSINSKSALAQRALIAGGVTALQMGSPQVTGKPGEASGLTTNIKRDRHVLSVYQRKRIHRIQSWATMRGALAGVVSGVVSGLAEYFLSEHYGTDGFSGGSGEDKALYWTFLLLVTIVASVIEIVYLYYDMLKTTIRISRTTGLRLLPTNAEREFLTAGLARTALEIPHPRSAFLGIDPLKESSKFQRAMSAVLYKGKTGITTLIVRMLLKRVLARAAAKTFLPFVGVLVNATWNALVCHKVLREARVVAIGPSAAVDTLDNLFEGMNVEFELRVFLWRVVAVSIVKKHCRHPNSEVIVRHLFRRFGRVRVEDVDDEDALLKAFGKFDQERQLLGLRVLALCLIIDGYLKHQERDLLMDCLKICDLYVDRGIFTVTRLLHEFVDGKCRMSKTISNLFSECLVPHDETDATRTARLAEWEKDMYDERWKRRKYECQNCLSRIAC